MNTKLQTPKLFAGQKRTKKNVYLLTHFPGSARNNLQRMICGTTGDKDLSLWYFNPPDFKLEIILSFYHTIVLQNVTSTSTLLMIFYNLITGLFDII